MRLTVSGAAARDEARAASGAKRTGSLDFGIHVAQLAEERGFGIDLPGNLLVKGEAVQAVNARDGIVV
jgi:DNA polymerase/3'-5' exonuclease PolX